MLRHMNEFLRCPSCAKNGKGVLKYESNERLVCTEVDCERFYPIINGIPILLSEQGDFLGYKSRILGEGF